VNYQLPTLRLGTEFDRPIVPITVPGQARTGSDSALCILDGANRAPRRLSRMVRHVGLLGIKVANPEGGVRVTMTLIADEHGSMMWRNVESGGDETVELPDEFQHHRMLEVTAQGRVRGAALFARHGTSEADSRYQLHFDVHAEEIGESGLLMFGLGEPTSLPEWAARDLLPNSPVGLCVGNVKLEELAPEPLPPSVSGGRPRVHGTAVAGKRPGFFVVNPGNADRPVTVTLRPLVPGQPRPPGRRALVKAPLVNARRLARRAAMQGVLRKPVLVEAVAADGSEVLRSTLERSGSSDYRFRLPAGSGPVYARATVSRDEGEPQPLDWLVSVEPGPDDSR
jgi:hypothetical protein